ncbi:MAG: LytTR family transcriptional regulator DNA-binding domain-containing protein, partial [Lachnospiraceae bacterium]|nr:LytTR family transcriptional regulator DNA-binding domain-containing protein [Lachnospiraceae bacterium]
LAVKIRGDVYVIPLEEIVDLENRLRKIRIRSSGEDREFYGTFDDVMQKLDERFLLCSRSYILNKDRIRAMRCGGQYEIIMDNGDHLPFSKKLFERAKNDFDAYLRAKV